MASIFVIGIGINCKKIKNPGDFMPNTVGQKMSEYTPLSSLTDEQQRTYLGNAAVTTFGTKEAGGATINVNVPLDEIKPTVPVTDVQVGGISVLNNGVAEVPAIPDASSLADGTSITASNGKLSAAFPVTDVTVGGTTVLNNGVAEVPAIPAISGSSTIDYVSGSGGKLVVKVPVPPPGQNHADVGKVLTVKTIDNTDEVVWDEPSSPTVVVDGSTITNSQQGLKVHPGWGLQEGSGALMARLTEHGGLEFDEEESDRGIQVATTKGLALHEYGVGIDLTGAGDGKVLTAVDSGETDSDDNPIYNVEWKPGVPPTTSAQNGEVLTYTNGGIDWAPVQGGGGGGGNPYTKVSVAPGTRYKNGKTSSYYFELYDQDVNISNNTYAVVNTPLGFDGSASFPDAKGLDVLKIKLPADTAFPMAVVEFTVYQNTSSYDYGSVNDVEVYVGETKLTHLYSHPYNPDTVIGKNIYSDQGQTRENPYGSFVYYHTDGLWNSNLLFNATAFVANENHAPVVQVNIFGNCFTINTNTPGGEPAAS